LAQPANATEAARTGIIVFTVLGAKTVAPRRKITDPWT
jgi:hypothetical protein